MDRGDKLGQPDVATPERPLGRRVATDEGPLDEDGEEEGGKREHCRVVRRCWSRYSLSPSLTKDVEERQHEQRVEGADGIKTDFTDLQAKAKTKDDDCAGQPDAQALDE